MGLLKLIALLLPAFALMWLLGNYLHHDSASSFDPDYCRRINKRTALACIAIVISEVLLLALVKPHGTCTGWNAALEIAGPMTVFICLPAALVPLVQTFRWQRFVQRTNESIALHPQLRLNINRLMLVVCVGWAVFCSVPIWVLFGTCTRGWI